MASAIETARADNRAALARQREKTKRLEHTLVRKATVLTVAATLGTMNRFGVRKAWGPVPWKPLLALAATVTEAMTKGNLQAAAGGVADTTMAIYVNDAITTNTYIAGDEPDDDDAIDVEGHETRNGNAV